jgi:hypothetical protein
MASSADTGLTAGSNIVSGAGASTLAFTLPDSPRYLIQSVVATINNTAGAATTATLTYSEADGTVIAKRRQGETVDAGATTTATWALRLSGKAGTTTTMLWGRYRGGPTAIAIAPGATLMPWVFVDGTALLDLSSPTSPQVTRDGFYIFSDVIDTVAAVPGAFAAILGAGSYQRGNASVVVHNDPNINAKLNEVSLPGAAKLVATEALTTTVWQNLAVGQTFNHVCDILYFASA